MTHRPHLDPSTLTNDEQVLDAVDELLSADAVHKAFRKRVLKRQQQLKKLSTDEAWRAYLRIEETTNARAEHVVLTVVRWAFEQGLKAGASRRPEGS